MRQLAWLHATPEGAKKCRAESLMETDAVNLIDLDWGEHLVSSLLEIGPALSGMAGPIPITYQEIKAWAELTNIDMPWYEPGYLRMLSREYCAESHAAKEPNRPKPMLEHNPETVADSFKKMVDFLKG